MTVILQETTRTILGVPGRARNVVTWHGNGSEKAPNEIANQKWTSEARKVSAKEWGSGAVMTVELRFDDNCKNGHKSFGLTGEIKRPGRRDVEACGCLHDEARRYFPELAPLIDWHLTSEDGPMHYIANTCYHASDRDHNGLAKGEVQQIVNGRTKEPVWQLVTRDHHGEEVKGRVWMDAHDKPSTTFTTEWEPVTRTGEGKPRDLEAARASAVWPDAPDSILTGPRCELEAALRARHANVVAEFKEAMRHDCGFVMCAPSV